MRKSLVKELILDTLRDIRGIINIKSRVDEVIIPKLHPWVASYVLFEDGVEGCGFSAAMYMGTFRLPSVCRVTQILHKVNQTNDTYRVVEELVNTELERMEDQVLANAIAISTLNALSYRLLDAKNLQSHGYLIEEYPIGGLLFGHSIGMSLKELLNRDDKIAVVGFAYWLFPYIVDIAREVKCLELVEKHLYDVYTLSGMKPQIEVSEDWEEVLKRADVVLVTGMTISNETLPEIITCCKRARLKVAYGPSCSFYPKRLFRMGFDLLFAMKVPVDYATRLKILDGRGLHPYEDPFTRLVIIKK